MDYIDYLQSRIIGSGIDGIVFKAGFQTKPNFVSKIGTDKIKEEFNNINLIKSKKFNDLPMKLNGVELKELTGKNRKNFIDLMIKTDGNNRFGEQIIYQLQIPLIDGIELYDEFEKYKAKPYKYARVNHNYNKEKQEANMLKSPITVSEFIRLFISVKSLYIGVKAMNENGIFHNDIHESNILKDKNDLLYLIDFSRVTLDYEIPDEENEEGDCEYYPDMEQVTQLVEQCIWYGCENPILYSWFVQNSYIPNVPFSPTEKLKEHIENFVSTKCMTVEFNYEDIINHMNKYY